MLVITKDEMNFEIDMIWIWSRQKIFWTNENEIMNCGTGNNKKKVFFGPLNMNQNSGKIKSTK
jgi:hypothetical protein